MSSLVVAKISFRVMVKGTKPPVMIEIKKGDIGRIMRSDNYEKTDRKMCYLIKWPNGESFTMSNCFDRVGNDEIYLSRESMKESELAIALGFDDSQSVDY